MGEVYLLGEIALPVTEKESMRKGKKSIGPRMKYNNRFTAKMGNKTLKLAKCCLVFAAKKVAFLTPTQFYWRFLANKKTQAFWVEIHPRQWVRNALQRELRECAKAE